MAADAVGYSRLVEADEAGTLAALRALRREVIDPLLAEHHGRVVKLMGDGVIVEFGSVVDAVACAAAVQQGVATRQAGVPPERRIVFRIGVNLGDVVVEGLDLLGDGVNVAARLEQLCEPGGVLVSGTAYDHLQGKLDLPLQFVGEQQLKNIDRPVRAYRVRLDGGGAAAPPSRARRRRWTVPAAAAILLGLLLAAGASWWPRPQEPALTGRPALAVLPFDNLGGDEATGRLADGITEDIITDLARFGDLDVIARNSTAVYKGRPVDVRQIGKDLDVGFVLEGSIQRQADRVRVTAQLVDTGSGAHVWSERWDRPTGDIFAVQAEVAEAVAGAIGGGISMAAITASAVAQAKRRPPAKLMAYDHYLLAADGKAKRTKEAVLAALEHASTAIALDPELARAYATRAYLRFFAVASSGDLLGALQGMEADARRAAELDPRDAEAQAALAFAYALTGRLAEAEAEVTRAVGENPANIHVLVIAANILPFAGKPELGARYADKALRLDPRMQPGNIAGVTFAYFFTRRFDDVLAVLVRIPREGFNRRLAFVHAAALAQLGRATEVGPAKDFLLARYLNISAELVLDREFRVLRRQEEELILDSFRKLDLPVCAAPGDLAGLANPLRLAECVATTG
jgi:TolB-like protein/class 3 adenylate cyclase